MSDEKKFYKELSERIRLKRAEKGCTLREVAEATGVSVQFINDLEKGNKKLSLFRFAKLSKFLKVGL